jgi:hypothetical protein
MGAHRRRPDVDEAVRDTGGHDDDIAAGHLELVLADREAHGGGTPSDAAAVLALTVARALRFWRI